MGLFDNFQMPFNLLNFLPSEQELQTERIGARSKLDAEKSASDYEKRGFKTKITKEGTNNYVVFDEDLIEILAKYGIVGGVGIGAMKSAQDNNQQPQGLLY